MLKIVKTIKPQDWMTARESRAVMKALNGKEGGKALFVGGCVRNALLKWAVKDIDIATVWTPPEIMQKLQAAGIKAIPTGIDHGTVTAVIGKKHFEITTLRLDVETDGRRAVVAFTKDWREDAARRDFTINTLLADEKGHIYDPTGQGLKDLKAGKVHFVGDASVRIAEDILRILRFFRFHAIYGKGAPDARGLKACRAAAGKIKTLSRERITQEFLKILSVKDPSKILAIMFRNNVLKEFAFKNNQLSHLSYSPSLSTRLLMMAGLKLSNVQKMEKLLLLPKALKKEIESINEVLKIKNLGTEQGIKLALYKQGLESTEQAILISAANGKLKPTQKSKALKIIRTWKIPKFPVTGTDLKKSGMKEGPEIGRKLKKMEAKWISRGFLSGEF
jgi:poly(A) polymerase